MKTYFLIFHLITFAYDVTTQNPPLLSTSPRDSQKIVTPGMAVALTCPVAGDRRQMLFEWYKGKESLISFGGHRFRITANGALRIKEAAVEDTGVYTCRAVNGFGSIENNITLVVLDDGEEEDYEDVSYSDPEDTSPYHEADFTSHKTSVASKPRLVYVTDWPSPDARQVLGSSVKLHCLATGSPRPHVAWTKDGGELPKIAKRGRWSLWLHNLQLSHSGNYTCTARNREGSTSHSFYVDVTISTQQTRDKPMIMEPHPSNTTVQEGNIAVLHCILRSLVPPHIEWLKRVEPDEMHDDNINDVIEVGEENFRVIKSSDTVNRPDGSYFNKLIIEQPTVKDSGKYICLGANTIGYSYRSAFLNVIPKPLPGAVTESLPFPIVVAVIVFAVASISGFISLLIYCRNRHRGGRNNSATAEPMVKRDNTPSYPERSTSIGNQTYETVHCNQVIVYVPSAQ